MPNLIQNTFEIVKIVIGDDDAPPRFALLSVLHLPPLIRNTSLFHSYCRAEPNPTGSVVVSSRSESDRPFHDRAEDAIVIFNLSYDHVFRTQLDWLTIIVHRRALLAHVPAAHRACAPFRSAPEPAPALVEVPWSVWGPPATRLFVGNPTRMHYIETTAGQRAVVLEDRMPTPIIVRDFNPYAVRAARALASASESGQAQQGGRSTRLPNGNRMSVKVGGSVLTGGHIFEEDVWSSLPYVEVVTQGEYRYDGVMMDDERIVGFQVTLRIFVAESLTGCVDLPSIFYRRAKETSLSHRFSMFTSWGRVLGYSATLENHCTANLKLVESQEVENPTRNLESDAHGNSSYSC
jgi:hypothetical protein